MAIPDYPNILPKPLADGGDKQSLPVDSNPTSLNFTDGWPVVYQVPKQAGGILPQRTGFNALMNITSQPLVYWQAGGQPIWQSTLDYGLHYVIVGSDGIHYKSIRPSGPGVLKDGNVVGPKDPTDDQTYDYWAKFQIGYPLQPIPDDVVWYVRLNGNDEIAAALVKNNPMDSENVDEKAFKTIEAACETFISTYYGTSSFTFTVQLGEPGVYISEKWVNLFVPPTTLAASPIHGTTLGFSQYRYRIRGNFDAVNNYNWVIPNFGESSTTANIYGWSLEGLSIDVKSGTSKFRGFLVSNTRILNCNVDFNDNSVGTTFSLLSIVGTTNFVKTNGGSLFSLGTGFNLGQVNGPSTILQVDIGNATFIEGRQSTIIMDNSVNFVNSNVTGPRYNLSLLSSLVTNGRIAVIPGTTGILSGNSVVN